MLNFILKNPLILSLTAIVILSLSLFKSCGDLEKAEKELEKKEAYISAFEDNLQGTYTTLEMTREELRASKDSINQLIYKLIEEKGYESTITRAERIESEFKTALEVEIRDTVFIEGARFDTLMRDTAGFYNIKISGEYPNKLSIIPEVKSELVLFTHTVEEYTGKRPAKTKIGVGLRKIFCRKKWRTKYVTDVEDLNPYIIVKNTRIIQFEEE